MGEMAGVASSVGAGEVPGVALPVGVREMTGVGEMPGMGAQDGARELPGMASPVGVREAPGVASPGEMPGMAPRVGGAAIGAGEPVAIAANATSSVEVHVPAPPDGCLHLIKISLGEASTVFYGRGPAAC